MLGTTDLAEVVTVSGRDGDGRLLLSVPVDLEAEVLGLLDAGVSE